MVIERHVIFSRIRTLELTQNNQHCRALLPPTDALWEYHNFISWNAFLTWIIAALINVTLSWVSVHLRTGSHHIPFTKVHISESIRDALHTELNKTSLLAQELTAIINTGEKKVGEEGG